MKFALCVMISLMIGSCCTMKRNIDTSFFIFNENDYKIEFQIKSKNCHKTMSTAIAGVRAGYGVPTLSLDDNVTVTWIDNSKEFSKTILISDYVKDTKFRGSIDFHIKGSHMKVEIYHSK